MLLPHTVNTDAEQPGHAGRQPWTTPAVEEFAVGELTLANNGGGADSDFSHS